MDKDKKIYSFKCKGCGSERQFVDQGVKTEETTSGTFRVRLAFNPDFPGSISCGHCGETHQYEVGDVRRVETTS
ncbi:MAG: hypothetical protein ACLP7O_05015 [Terracidiphilus sp.]